MTIIESFLLVPSCFYAPLSHDLSVMLPLVGGLVYTAVARLCHRQSSCQLDSFNSSLSN